MGSFIVNPIVTIKYFQMTNWNIFWNIFHIVSAVETIAAAKVAKKKKDIQSACSKVIVIVFMIECYECNANKDFLLFIVILPIFLIDSRAISISFLLSNFFSDFSSLIYKFLSFR